METKRGNERYSYPSPDFVYVRLRVGKGPEENRERILNVIDSSKSGLAFLVTRKDADLLEILSRGDRISDMRFFGIGAKIKGEGTVRHVTEIVEGKYKGSYLLGVEASDLEADGPSSRTTK